MKAQGLFIEYNVEKAGTDAKGENTAVILLYYIIYYVILYNRQSYSKSMQGKQTSKKLKVIKPSDKYLAV